MTEESKGFAPGQVVISGGTFSYAVEDKYIVEGNTAILGEDGFYYIGADTDTAVASVDGIGYPSLQVAIGAANGKTVVLLSEKSPAKDLSISEGMDVTLDLNGFTLYTAVESNGNHS